MENSVAKKKFDVEATICFLEIEASSQEDATNKIKEFIDKQYNSKYDFNAIKANERTDLDVRR